AWLRHRRKQIGATQYELAESIGCSRIALQKIEAGERHPSRQIALLLAGYFKVPVNEREAFVTFARTGLNRAEPAGREIGQAPWRTAHARQTNIPAVLTALIGREREEAELQELLVQPRGRLPGRHGPPGRGNT